MAKKRYDNDFPSVTEILGVIRKPALEYWFKTHTSAECDELSKKGRDVGTQIHALIKQWATGEEPEIETMYKNELETVVESFKKFKTDWYYNKGMKIRASEFKCFCDTTEVNGTVDAICELKDKCFVVDWKSGNAKNNDTPPVYPEYIIQASIYTHILRNYEMSWRVNSPPLIVTLAKDKVAYGVYEVSRLEQHQGIDAFKQARVLYENLEWLEKKIKEKGAEKK
jgi:hypothetical protein